MKLKKLNRESRTGEKISKQIKSPTELPNETNSKGAYFKHKKAKLPDEIEEETEKDKFIKKWGNRLEI